MSLFFALITLATWGLSHWWARKSLPSQSLRVEIKMCFDGTPEIWQKKLLKTIGHNPRMTVVEKSSTHLIVNEAPGMFSFGAFHHIHWEKVDETVEVRFSVQPKLIISNPSPEAGAMTFTSNIDLKNVG